MSNSNIPQKDEFTARLERIKKQEETKELIDEARRHLHAFLKISDHLNYPVLFHMHDRHEFRYQFMDKERSLKFLNHAVELLKSEIAEVEEFTPENGVPVSKVYKAESRKVKEDEGEEHA